MSDSPDPVLASLRGALASLLQQATIAASRAPLASAAAPPAGLRLAVAWSGGLDSSVLLHALCALRGEFRFALQAVHVHHGLQAAAGDWVVHCRQQAARLGVPLQVCHVRVDPQAGEGLEAAAREARYRALSALDCDVMVLGQHLDDQAETVMLQLLRGAGPAGLAAMGRNAAPVGHPLTLPLLRPFLSLPRTALLRWAQDHAVAWIEDPSNQDLQFDRNYLRAEVGPRLQARFPGWRQALARSATWAAEAADLLADLARIDLAAMTPPLDPSQLPGTLVQWQALPVARIRNLLRHLLARAGLPSPPAARLSEWLRQWSAAQAQVPELRWSDCALRRWHHRLWLERVPASPGLADVSLTCVPGVPAEWQLADGSRLLWWPQPTGIIPGAGPAPGAYTVASAPWPWPRLPVDAARADRPVLPPGRWLGLPIALDLAALGAGPGGAGLTISWRPAAYRLQVRPSGPQRELRKLFQEHDIPPWRRARLPRLLQGRALLAVPGLAVRAAVQSRTPARLAQPAGFPPPDPGLLPLDAGLSPLAPGLLPAPPDWQLFWQDAAWLVPPEAPI